MGCDSWRIVLILLFAWTIIVAFVVYCALGMDIVFVVPHESQVNHSSLSPPRSSVTVVPAIFPPQLQSE